jgi:hypothetical protein
MLAKLVEVLVYAGALNLYRRENLREIRLSRKESNAVLDLVEWTNRPALLEK